MRRTCAFAFAVLASVATVATAPQLLTVHVETRLVVLQATVTNRHGDRISDLDSQAFTVFENGRQQPIELFQRGDVPVSVGLLIDNSRSMGPLRADVEAAALAFARASNPMDDVFVLNFADTPRLDVPFTSDIRVLESGIARVDAIGGTALRDALVLAEDYLREHGAHDRKALVVITDGRDNASVTSTSDLRGVVQRNQAAVFAIGLFRADDPMAHKGRDELDHLVELAGGRAYYPASIEGIGDAVQELAREIRTQYTIAYTPTNQALDGSYRTIQVKVTSAGGASVRTRPGYWATAVSSAAR
jgi:Ca-activated chloride channel family protein